MLLPLKAPYPHFTSSRDSVLGPPIRLPVGPLLALFLFACAPDGPPIPPADPPDLSAIDRFWPIHEALLADQDPPDEAWNTLFATPAWHTLGGFRQEQARQRYELAFRPSRVAELGAALAEGGHEAAVLRHLVRVTVRSEELRRYHAALARGEVSLDLEGAVLRVAPFLPSGTMEEGPRPGVAAAFFEPDGYADGRVVVDLFYLMELGDEGARALLAHELHHVYQARGIAPFERPAWGSSDQVLLEALFQLQREGTANLVDKWSPNGGVGGALEPERVAWFRREMARSPEILARMEGHLERMAGADPDESLRLAQEIRWRVLPGSGHPTGLHMAIAILEKLGKDALTGTLSNPFDFVRAYNEAAQAGAGRPLGSGAMVVLDQVEGRTFGEGAASGAPDAKGAP